MPLTEENRWKGGRGTKKYFYDVCNLAIILNRSESAIRNDISAGKLSMGSLLSVVDYVQKHRKDFS